MWEKLDMGRLVEDNAARRVKQGDRANVKSKKRVHDLEQKCWSVEQTRKIILV